MERCGRIFIVWMSQDLRRCKWMRKHQNPQSLLEICVFNSTMCVWIYALE